MLNHHDCNDYQTADEFILAVVKLSHHHHHKCGTQQKTVVIGGKNRMSHGFSSTNETRE